MLNPSLNDQVTGRLSLGLDDPDATKLRYVVLGGFSNPGVHRSDFLLGRQAKFCAVCGQSTNPNPNAILFRRHTDPDTVE